MPKVLFAVENLESGMGRVAWGLANHLSDRQEVHILTNHKYGGLTARRQIAVHLVSRLVSHPFVTVAYSTILRRSMSKVMSQVSPDIVHPHITLPWGYTLRSIKGTKSVVTPSGSDVFPRKGRVTGFFLDRALRDSSAVVCNSKWLSRYVQKHYQVEPVVIPTGVDTQAFRPLGDSAERKVVLYVGRLIEKKGLLELMQAARALPEYEFWLAGKGPLEIPVLPNVKILGFHDDIASLYARATLCAFASHSENFPNTGLEAMACGRTLVATERGFSEYIEDGKDGLLIKPHDVRSLIDSIRYLMENVDVRRRLERNAREKATQYDWKVIAKRYEALYDAL